MHADAKPRNHNVEIFIVSLPPLKVYWYISLKLHTITSINYLFKMNEDWGTTMDFGDAYQRKLASCFEMMHVCINLNDYIHFPFEISEMCTRFHKCLQCVRKFLCPLNFCPNRNENNGCKAWKEGWVENKTFKWRDSWYIPMKYFTSTHAQNGLKWMNIVNESSRFDKRDNPLEEWNATLRQRKQGTLCRVDASTIVVIPIDFSYKFVELIHYPIPIFSLRFFESIRLFSEFVTFSVEKGL